MVQEGDDEPAEGEDQEGGGREDQRGAQHLVHSQVSRHGGGEVFWRAAG